MGCRVSVNECLLDMSPVVQNANILYARASSVANCMEKHLLKAV